MPPHDPQMGDIFVVERAGPHRVVGRVVSTSAIVGPTHGCMLVYLCRDDAPRPQREHLLVAPILTLRSPWARGYFVHRGSAPLLPGEYFERHTFRDPQGRLVDEEGRPVAAAQPGEPIGEGRLYDVDAIEAALRAALGE
jgi:hypothetical protein